jgi:hypothetical protein
VKVAVLFGQDVPLSHHTSQLTHHTHIHSPRNRCGVSATAIARPPVLIVVKNHAQVKCFRRWRRLVFSLISTSSFCVASSLVVILFIPSRRSALWSLSIYRGDMSILDVRKGWCVRRCRHSSAEMHMACDFSVVSVVMARSDRSRAS